MDTRSEVNFTYCYTTAPPKVEGYYFCIFKTLAGDFIEGIAAVVKDLSTLEYKWVSYDFSISEKIYPFAYLNISPEELQRIAGTLLDEVIEASKHEEE